MTAAPSPERLDPSNVECGRARGSDTLKPKPPVPLRYWVSWYAELGAALVLFYVIFTPFWFGLRSLAWLAEFRARRRGQA